MNKQIPTNTYFRSLGAGRLGAFVAGFGDREISAAELSAAQIDMIERRILRLEMVLRMAGIEVDQLELPQ
jgi:hypothetical protein